MSRGLIKIMTVLFLVFIGLTVPSVPVQSGHAFSAGTLEENSFSNSKPNQDKKARVAIVIDDFGQHNTDGVKDIISLGIPITCAIMPNMENTRGHAEEAARKGHQVIVHLPLEPINGKKSWLGPGAITMNLQENEITNRVRNDFASVPHAVGFNNHMGSAVTVSDKMMRPILQVARENGFFVLDSRTNDKSVIPVLSDELGIAWAQRDIFLDNVKSPGHVDKQFDILARKALENGKAVAIGHVGQGGNVTARLLKEKIPQLQKQGIEFVYLSEIVNTNIVDKWIPTMPAGD